MSRLTASLLAGGAFLIAAPAFAADLPQPVPSAPVEPAPVTITQPAPAGFDWTGVYFGGLAGYAWGHVGYTGFGGAAGTDGTATADDFVGGIYAGYNWQATPNIVVGAEADIGLGRFNDIDGGPAGVDADVNFLSTIRGRVGYAWNNLLLYGTGGLAILNAEASSGGTSDSNTHLGWTLGAGVEALVTDNITVRGEYLYVDTGTEYYDLGADSYDADINAHIARVGIGYKF